MKRKVCIAVAAMAGIGALFFVGVSANYALSYFTEPANPLRHEYLQGVAIAASLSIPFWLVASASLLPVRDSVPRIAYLATHALAGIACLSFLAASIYVVAIAAMDR
jgi:hypothetical protein